MKPKPVIDYIQRELLITQGAGAGENFRLFPWEKRFLKGMFSCEGDCAISVPRGAGKSTLLSAVAAAFVDGPLRVPRGEVVVCAASFSQARIIYDHAVHALGEKVRDKRAWRALDSLQSCSLEHRETGARLRCIASDPKRAHGLAPALVLADEGAQWPHTTSERMLAALRTSMGKIEGSRLIALGTRPEDSQHWFQVMLNGGAAYSQSHHADPEDDPFSKRVWRKANPSLKFMPSLMARYEAEAAEAKADPSKLASFKALRLNMGTADTLQSFLLEAKDWEKIEGEADRRGPFVMGVDLGQNAAQSALAAYWPESGRLEALACFPELPSLAERGLQDGVGRLYLDVFDRGELIIRGKRVSDIRGLLAEARARWGYPIALACDRWREMELRDCLEAEGYPLARLEVRGMGFRDGSEDVRDFRSACLGGRVTPLKSLLLTSAMAEARVAVDPAGNAKLAKGVEGGRRMRARDDAVAAAILSVASGVRLWRDNKPSEGGVYFGMTGRP